MNWSEAIKNRELSVGVMGLGYVGLPLAVAFARAGFSVSGFDVDHEKVSKIQRGRSPLTDLTDREVSDPVDAGRLVATTEMSRLSGMDAISICVPTPLRKSRDPDMSYIHEAVNTLRKHISPPVLLTLESTTYPGTTEEIIVQAFKNGNDRLPEDVLVAFSPERIDPGNANFGIENTPKVVGGRNEASLEVARGLYGEIVDRVVPVSCTESAEMVKLLENTFRSVNIALANEMALLCDRMDIDVWEVINAAGTKPFGFMSFYPGPGLGGHCIPIDPLFLSWKARTYNTSSRFIELADEVNRQMPIHTVQQITRGLNRFNKSVRDARICVFGVAYKPNVNDTRESPAYDVVGELVELGGAVSYCDPHVRAFRVGEHDIPSLSPGEAARQTFDVGVILTNHDTFSWDELTGCSTLFVDTRNALDVDRLDGSITRLTL